ncbi:hypothetical protein MMC17_000158 [Xylographa soralifera]|nr:hypothetical protein [Xylographa soralifera]
MLVIASLLILNAFGLALNILVTYIGLTTEKDTALYTQPPGKFIPEFPFRPTHITHDAAYLSASDELGEDLWEHILPAGAGYFKVPYPRRQGLPVSKPVTNSTKSEEVYILSVAHQLHCLGAVRGIVLAHERGDPPKDDHGHARHCLDKVREALMCSADTTTEVGYPRLDADGEVVAWDVDDKEVTHQCRDWNAIKSWLYDNRLNSKHGLKHI